MKRLMTTCALLGVLTGCEYVSDGWIFQPFEGPGYELGEGLLIEPEPGETWLAAATYLPVSKEGSLLFDDAMTGIQAELEEGPQGLVGYSLAQKIVGREYRTVTVWESEAEMMDFVLGPAHTQAMVDSAEIADPEGQPRVVRWEIEPDALPLDWDEVIERTDFDGRDVVY